MTLIYDWYVLENDDQTTWLPIDVELVPHPTEEDTDVIAHPVGYLIALLSNANPIECAWELNAMMQRSLHGVSVLQEIHAKFLTDQYRNGLWTLEHWQSLMAEAGVCACICDECSDKGLHLYPCDGPHRQHPIHPELEEREP